MISSTRIGIVGGGQLGKMLTIAAKKLGFYVTVSDPTPQSPAGQVADYQIIADYKNEKATRQLVKNSDYVTVELEGVNDEVLLDLIKKGKIIHPSPKTLSIIRDKLKQKEFLRKNRIPVAPFISVETKDDVKKAAKKFGYPLLLKVRTDAFDGRGNVVLKNEKGIDNGFKKLENRLLYVEQYIDFKKELAVMVARNIKGDISVYPVVETVQKNNICDIVIAPAQISKSSVKKATVLAKKVIKHFKGAGVFGIEMFLKKDDNVLVNEIAPRVHNSGHYTIEACTTSQFEQHIRAISNLPLGETTMITKYAVMKNILGTKQESGFPKGLSKTLKIPGVSVHIYGKNESRPQRKMGHITVVGDNLKTCLKKAEQARKALVI